MYSLSTASVHADFTTKVLSTVSWPTYLLQSPLPLSVDLPVVMFKNSVHVVGSCTQNWHICGLCAENLSYVCVGSCNLYASSHRHNQAQSLTRSSSLSLSAVTWVDYATATKLIEMLQLYSFTQRNINGCPWYFRWFWKTGQLKIKERAPFFIVTNKTKKTSLK